VKEVEMGWACSTKGEKRNAYRLFVGTPRRRWVVNIKMDLGDIGWGGVGWIGLAQHRDKWRVLNAAINLRVP
jgi:hypothetical protein